MRDEYDLLRRIASRALSPTGPDLDGALRVGLIVPLDDSMLTPAGKLRLLHLTDPQGRNWLPAFGDLPPFQRWIRKDRRYAEFLAARLFQIAAQDRFGVVLSPDSKEPTYIEPCHVVDLAEGRAPGDVVLADLANLTFADAHPDPELVQLAAGVARSNSSVLDAYVVMGAISNGPVHPVIGILFRRAATSAQKVDAFAAFQAKLQPILGSDFATCIELSEAAIPAFAARARG